MPNYNGPFIPPQLVQKGVPCYLFGKLNMLQGNASGTVADTTLATNVGTVTVQINQGPIPLVNDLITVGGTSSQTGLFNVTRAFIAAVSITPATNAGTISYALTGSNQTITADTGMFLCEPGEQPDTLAAGKSIAVCIQAPEGDSQFTLPLAVSFPGGVLPTAVTVTLQVAIRDIDSEYTNVTNGVVTVAGTAFTAGPVIQVTLQRGYFYRVVVSGLTLGSATGIAVKIGG